MMYHRKHRLVAQLLTARNGAQAAGVGKETKEEKREVRRPHPSGNEVCILYQRHCISLLSHIHDVLEQRYILIELEEIRCISRHRRIYPIFRQFKSFCILIYVCVNKMCVQITQSQIFLQVTRVRI